ncbi:MAG: exosortase/archaeosortase family protein [Bacteroidales bacterium]|nr:exosortase/archaeosortase family protein [Bacteroidales bacterium]
MKLPAKIAPYSGVIYFVVILVASHFFWKFTVLGDESDTLVTFFGLDISAPFNYLASHVARVTADLLQTLGFSVQLEPNNMLHHENNTAVRIVWACTGLKQAYIFICIIAFYRGPIIRKLWYIPAGLVVVYLFNIFRIAAITAIIEQHPGWFDILHEHLFKYLFYVVIFGMWVLWEEKISRKKTVELKDEKMEE